MPRPTYDQPQHAGVEAHLARLQLELGHAIAATPGGPLIVQLSRTRHGRLLLRVLGRLAALYVRLAPRRTRA